ARHDRRGRLPACLGRARSRPPARRARPADRAVRGQRRDGRRRAARSRRARPCGAARPRGRGLRRFLDCRAHDARADLGAPADRAARPARCEPADRGRRFGRMPARGHRTTRLHDRRTRQHPSFPTGDQPTMTVLLRFAALAAFVSATPALAQQPAAEQPASCLPQGMFTAPAAYKSVEQLPDGRVTFRICAPEAHEVRVTSNDVDEAIPTGFQPGTTRGLVMTRDATGLWTATTPVRVTPDTYRFNFQVDGARVPDPQGTTFSHERVGT